MCICVFFYITLVHNYEKKNYISKLILSERLLNTLELYYFVEINQRFIFKKKKKKKWSERGERGEVREVGEGKGGEGR